MHECMCAYARRCVCVCVCVHVWTCMCVHACIHMFTFACERVNSLYSMKDQSLDSQEELLLTVRQHGAIGFVIRCYGNKSDVKDDLQQDHHPTDPNHCFQEPPRAPCTQSETSTMTRSFHSRNEFRKDVSFSKTTDLLCFPTHAAIFLCLKSLVCFMFKLAVN